MQRNTIPFAKTALHQSAREALYFSDQPLVCPDVFADKEGYTLGASACLMVQRFY
jgi:hypothetical protein